MLSQPGGLFLDVKSAYSTASDIHLFCAGLEGLGVHVKVSSHGEQKKVHLLYDRVLEVLLLLHDKLWCVRF